MRDPLRFQCIHTATYNCESELPKYVSQSSMNIVNDRIIVLVEKGDAGKTGDQGLTLQIECCLFF